MKLSEGFSGERSIVIPKIITDMMRTDALCSELYITDIGYYPHAYGHYRRRETPINEYVLIYAADGNGWFEVNGRKFDVLPNTFFILPPGLPHTYGSDSIKPWTIYWIHYNGRLAGEYSPDTGCPHHLDPAGDSRIRERIKLFDEIFGTIDSGYSMVNLRYALSLFHHYLGSLRFLEAYRRAAGASDNMDIISATIHYMTENLERTLTLDHLSEYSGLSRSYLSASFKAKTGHAPLAYFNLLKIKYACELLDSTTMKINGICHKTGISDPYYFSRLFTKIMGISPTAYRQRPKS